MSFLESIQTVLRKYAEFTGRAGRAEFWWWALFNVLVLSALNVLNVFPVGENAYLGSVLAGLWSVAGFNCRVPGTAGRDWANLFWILLPIAGLIVLVVYWAQPSLPAAAPTVAEAQRVGPTA